MVRDTGSGVDLSLVKTLLREQLSNEANEHGADLSHQTPSIAEAAGIRERCRRQMMHFLVRFGAALAQDADAVQYYINICE